MMKQAKGKVRGFALVEILVALAIIGAALPALMLRMQSIANTTEFVESRTVAHWIAENKMQQLIADQRLQKNVSKMRKDQDKIEYDNQQWYWSVLVEELDLGALLAPEKMYRVQVDVGLQEGSPLASITGYLGD